MTLSDPSGLDDELTPEQAAAIIASVSEGTPFRQGSVSLKDIGKWTPPAPKSQAGAIRRANDAPMSPTPAPPPRPPKNLDTPVSGESMGIGVLRPNPAYQAAADELYYTKRGDPDFQAAADRLGFSEGWSADADAVFKAADEEYAFSIWGHAPVGDQGGGYNEVYGSDPRESGDVKNALDLIAAGQLAKAAGTGLVGELSAGAAVEAGPKVLPLGAGAASPREFIEKVVNSNMGHAADRAVLRAGFATPKEAREALQAFGKKLEEGGTLPAEGIFDPAHADRVIVPGFGKGGAVAYQVTDDGVYKLKTVLEWRPVTHD